MLFDKLKDTQLKSLKYGDDRPGGANSLEPIILKPILDVNTIGTIPTFNEAARENRKRIEALLNKTPRGLTFVSNQTGLQLSNTRLELSTGATLNRFGQSGGFGTEIARLLNTGIDATNTALGAFNRTANRLFRSTELLPYNPNNTITQVGALQGEHLDRFGLTPYINDNLKYINIVRANNSGIDSSNNRLVSLRRQLGVGSGAGSIIGRTQQKLKAFLGGVTSLTNAATSVANVFGGNSLLNQLNNKVNQIGRVAAPYLDPIIDRYIGGPGSVNGIGITTIRRFDFTNTKGQDTGRSSTRPFVGRAGGGLLNQTLSTYIGASIKYPGTINRITNKKPVPSVAINFSKLTAQINRANQSFFSASLDIDSVKYDYITESTNYINNKRIQIDLDRTSKTFDYVNEDSHRIPFYNRDDSANMMIVFQLINPFNGNDLPRIAFPAYINNFKVNTDATWNDISYIGRSEYLHVFHKFKRQVSFGFQIPCFNIVELRERHRALGNLESSLAGSYNNNKLGGIITKLYVGNYLRGETGIINSISYDIPNESSWDLEEQLAHNINVSINFTIIGNQLPEFKEDGGFFTAIPEGVKGKFIGNIAGLKKAGLTVNPVNVAVPTQVYTTKNRKKQAAANIISSIINSADPTAANFVGRDVLENPYRNFPQEPDPIPGIPGGFITDEEFEARKTILNAQEQQ
jgi:hypothetical protein